MSDAHSVTRRGQLPVGELAMAAGILGLGVYALVRAGSILEPMTAAGSVGPRTMPYLVGGMLVITGSLNLLNVLRGERGEAEGGEDVDLAAGTDWKTVALLAGALVVHAFLLDPLGWPISATFLFGSGATILGFRPVWRTFAIGFVIALAIQALFAGGLGVSLPAGPGLERLVIFNG